MPSSLTVSHIESPHRAVSFGKVGHGLESRVLCRPEVLEEGLRSGLCLCLFDRGGDQLSGVSVVLAAYAGAPLTVQAEPPLFHLLCVFQPDDCVVIAIIVLV